MHAIAHIKQISRGFSFISNEFRRLGTLRVSLSIAAYT